LAREVPEALRPRRIEIRTVADAEPTRLQDKAARRAA
jgi:hypothetical protein